MGEARVINFCKIIYYTTDARLHVLFARPLCEVRARQERVAELAAKHACTLCIGSGPVFNGRVAILLVELRVLGRRDIVLHVEKAVLPVRVRVEAFHPALAEQDGSLASVPGCLCRCCRRLG